MTSSAEVSWAILPFAVFDLRYCLIQSRAAIGGVFRWDCLLRFRKKRDDPTKWLDRVSFCGVDTQRLAGLPSLMECHCPHRPHLYVMCVIGLRCPLFFWQTRSWDSPCVYCKCAVSRSFVSLQSCLNCRLQTWQVPRFSEEHGPELGRIFFNIIPTDH